MSLTGSERARSVHNAIQYDELNLDTLIRYNAQGKHVKDFLGACLDRNAGKRIDAKRSLEHPWFDLVNKADIQKNELIETGENLVRNRLALIF